ncbi:MAG: hypothetical protein CSA76_01840 [Spirochaetales bacterium]|nr:MAG: hypothetical protein CSA76_01840 [Spirochaetales bacterium]
MRNFNLLYAGMPSAAEMRRLNASAKRRPEKHPEEREIFLRLLYLKGFVCLPPELVELPWKGAAVLGRWAVLEEEKLFLERKIRKLCLRPGGAEEAFLSVDERPRELLQSIAQCMLSEGVLIRRGKWLFPEGAPPLSPYHRSWLDRVAAEGPEGLRISGLKSSADIRVLEELGRSELIFGGSSLWLSGPEYSKCRSKLLNGFKQGDVLTMAEARERLAGSRAVTLEVLEVLEKEGFLSSPEHGQRRVLR